MDRKKKLFERINTPVFGFNGGHGLLQPMENADQHNEIELNFINSGQANLQHGGQTLRLSRGDAIIYWAAVPHQVLSVEQSVEFSWLVIPLSWFLVWNLPRAFQNHILHGEVLKLPPLADTSRLTQWADEISTGSPEVKKIIELELEAFFRRLALAFSPQKSLSSLPSAPNQCAHMQEMIQFMITHFRDSISISQIAASAGLNPEYAIRFFRKTWGMTPWSFLTQQRIFEAQRLLVTSNLKVVDVGFACGFGSTSRFYSVFAKYCQCSPLAYRRKHIAA